VITLSYKVNQTKHSLTCIDLFGEGSIKISKFLAVDVHVGPPISIPLPFVTICVGASWKRKRERWHAKKKAKAAEEAMSQQQET
jgi:hypothetical protein